MNLSKTPSDKPIKVFDLRDKWGGSYTIEESYDLALLAVCLQGLLNRDHPRLFIYGLPYGNWAKHAPPRDFDGNIDHYILKHSLRHGRWLENSSFERIDSLEDVIHEYRDLIQGVVVWDDAVPATSNVATTVASVENLLPVRYGISRYPSGRDHWYPILTDRLGLPVQHTMVDRFTGTGTIPQTNLQSSGSPKCDAYLWAKHHYLDTGKSRADLIGYVSDAFSRRYPDRYNQWLAMRDYLVAEKGFLVDVSVWEDETPIDDPDQPLGTDRHTLDQILQSAYAQTGGGKPIKVFGFPPWAEKYTDHPGVDGKHGAVETEWMLAKVVTPYNGHLVVDIYQGFTANLSLHRLAPPIEQQSQRTESPSSTIPSGASLSNPSLRTASQEKPILNVLFYMGDYCDIGAVYNILPINWDDPARGKLPLGWSFTPVMAELLPDFFRSLYESKTENDHFMLGPGLYGYNMPNNLSPGPVYEANRRLARKWCQKLDLDVTGFYIGYDPPSESTLNLYKDFTPVGMLTNHDHVRDAQAVVPHMGMYTLCTPGTDPAHAADNVINYVNTIYPDTTPQPSQGFVAFRCIWVEPTLIQSIVDQVKSKLPTWDVNVTRPHDFFEGFRNSEEVNT